MALGQAKHSRFGLARFFRIGLARVARLHRKVGSIPPPSGHACHDHINVEVNLAALFVSLLLKQPAPR
jgi:hypothetical protein